MPLKDYSTVQPKVMKLLTNSYNKGRLAHAYLFEGEKGTKKKEIALEFAKMLYCENKDNSCDICINCLRIEHNNHPNVLLIEPDNNTIKKEQILYLQQEYSKTNLEPGPKIYIIEDIDKMSNNAANSILKFIEEPHDNTYTILITDNLHQILPTIISRCQVINFQPIPKQEIIQYLIENQVDSYIASICANLTNDLEDALTIANENITTVIDLVTSIGHSILTGDENLVVICENSQMDLSKDKKLLVYFIDILLMYMRDIKKVDNNNENVIFIHELPFIKSHIQLISSEKIIYNINEILKAKISLEYNANTILLIDHLLINLM